MWGELYATRVGRSARLRHVRHRARPGGRRPGRHRHRGRCTRTPGLRAGPARLAHRPGQPCCGRGAAGQTPSPAHLSDGRIVSVVICDVNGLKRVNDERGHTAGDRLLIRVGELLGVAASRLSGALAGRLGGDEFCLVVEHLDADTVIDVVTELCRRALSLPGGAGVACGVASTADGVGRVVAPRDLVRLADGAQYHAKRSDFRVPVVAGRPLPDPPRAQRVADASRRRPPHVPRLAAAGTRAGRGGGGGGRAARPRAGHRDRRTARAGGRRRLPAGRRRVVVGVRRNARRATC